MRGFASTVIYVAVAAAAATALSPARSGDAAPEDIPYPCFEALLRYCAGTFGTNCTYCAGRYQFPLQRARCRPADINEACTDNLLRQFSLTLDNDGIDDQIRDFTYQLVTYGNASDPGNLQPVRPGAPMCFDASDDPDSNYFILGTHAVWNTGGRVRVDQSLLQFRLTDIHDPNDAVTIDTGWWDNINATNMTACENNGDGCVALGPAVTTTTVTVRHEPRPHHLTLVPFPCCCSRTAASSPPSPDAAPVWLQPYGTIDVGGGWQVTYNGLCGHHHGPDDEDDDDDADQLP
jgi:hypothetical protein